MSQAPSNSSGMIPTSSSRRLDWVVIAVLLVATAVRLFHLDYQSFWGDEAFSLQLVRQPFGQMLLALVSTEPYPPLYFGMLHLWRDIAGESDFALRLLAELFSLLAVAAVYGIGRQLLGQRTALAAALITAINPFQVWYAQEARMYGQLVALSACSVLFFLTALRSGGRGRWSLYTVVTLLAIYTHYHALLVVLFENTAVALLWLQDKTAPGGPAPPGLGRPRLRPWVATQVILVALFLPWAYFAQRIVRAWSGWMPLVDLPTMLTRTFSAQTLGTSFPSEWADVASVVLGIWAVLTIVVLARRRRFAAVFLALYALLPIVAAYVIGELLGRSLFHERYLIVVSPALYLLLGSGLGWRGKGWPLSTLGLLIVMGTAAQSLQGQYFDWRYQKDDLRGMARHIDANAREGDLVIASITRDWLYRHYAKVDVPVYLVPPEAPLDQIRHELATIVPGYRRVWYLPYARTEVDLAIDRWLAENTFPAQVQWFNTARTSLAGVAIADAPQVENINFDDRVVLAAASLPGERFVAGDVLGISLYWHAGPASSSPVSQLKASLRLLDARGHVYVQSDPPLGLNAQASVLTQSNEIVRDNFGLLVPVDTPPGEYQVELRVYDPNGGRDLPARGAQGASVGSSLVLRRITIGRPAQPARPEAQEIERRVGVDFGHIARLAGVGLLGTSWRAGDRVSVSLQWRALEPEGQDYRPVLRLRTAAGAEVAQHTVAADFPISLWRPGELVRQIEDWRLAPGLQEGTYKVSLDLESPDGSPLALAENGSSIVLGEVAIAGRPSYAPPSPPNVVADFTLGKMAKLVGYDLGTNVLEPGGSLRLALHWQALAETEESYKVFTHLLSSDEQVWGQHDSLPCDGQCPTSAWAEGETVVDSHVLKLLPNARSGTYRIEIGLYRSKDGQRLNVLGTGGQAIGDRIILGEVQVR